jgi:uncharacterized protein YggE
MGTSIITLSGHGEVQAVPDIASVSFYIRKEAKTVKEAQDAVAGIEKKALDFLKESGVAEKDIKTINTSFYPKTEYQYNRTYMPCTPYGCPPPGKDVIVGYESSENIEVKIRNVDKVGSIVEGLGSVGVQDLNGPNFKVDNEDALKAQARKEAIDDAKVKAETLAKDLGVRIVRIASFSDSADGGYPYPMMYGDAMMEGKAVGASAPAELPRGESTITSDVSISYEIR